MYSKLNRFFNYILNLHRIVKQSILIAFDIIIATISLWLAYSVRLEKFISIFEINFIIFFLTILLFLFIFNYFKVYLNLSRYFEINHFIHLSKIFLLYTFIYSILLFSLNKYFYFPRSIGIIQPIFFYFFIIFSRLAFFYIFYFYTFKKIKLRNVLIYGEGAEAIEMSNLLFKNNIYNLVGFISEDPLLFGKYISQLPIYNHENIEIIKKLNIKDIFICKSISNNEVSKIRTKYNSANVRILYTPSYSHFLHNNMLRLFTNDFEPDLVQLLNREKIKPDINLLKKNNFNKNILITGAGGSIGSELAKQVLKLKPKKMILLDMNEYSLFDLKSQIENYLDLTNIEIQYVLGSILDEKLLFKIFSENRINTIYHAAAYKHVSIVENNPTSALRNNILGTKILCDVSSKFTSIENFVFISTDKAVNPSNLMGASKRLCELIIKMNSNLNTQNKTKFSIVRFGNVLASSGSVINIFLKQISNGGPVTLTSKEVTRFFMTINEAVELVIQAGALEGNSQVYILDMGNPIKIYDILINLCNLYGLRVKDKVEEEGDIALKIIGLKKGEKMHEKLFYGNNISTTINKKILTSINDFQINPLLKEEINFICKNLNYNDDTKIIEQIYSLTRNQL